MNFISKRLRTLMLSTLASLIVFPTTAADAGLLDWLFPLRRQRTVYSAYNPYGYYGNGYGYGNAYSPYYSSYYYTPASNSSTIWSPTQTTAFSPVGLSSLQSCGAYAYQPQSAYTSYQPVVTAPTSGCGCTTGTTAWSPVTAAPTVSYSVPYSNAPCSTGTVQAFTGTATVANYGGYPNGYAFSPTVPATTATTTLLPTTTIPATTLQNTTVVPSTSVPASTAPTLATPTPAPTTTNYLPGSPTTDSNSHIPWTTVSPQASSQTNGDGSGSQLSPLPADRRPTIDPQFRETQETQSTGFGNSPLQPIPYLPPRQESQSSGLRGEYSDLDWLDHNGRNLDRRWEAVPISWNTENRPPAPRLLPPEPIKTQPSNDGGWESFSR